LRVAFKRFRYMLEALREILPGQFTDHRLAMRACQTRLGKIQDSRLLLGRLDKLRARAGLEEGAVEMLREELTRRQQRLIDEFLQTKDPLRNFWPPRGGIAKLLAIDNAGTRS
jgi:CHAD domain-containing protein